MGAMGRIMPQLLVVRCVARRRPVRGWKNHRQERIIFLYDDKLHGTKLTYTADKKAL
jgi:hypothetical protein